MLMLRLWIILLFLSCFCYAFMHVCLLLPCGHLQGSERADLLALFCFKAGNMMISCFMPPPFVMVGAYSITLVRTSVRTYVRPVRTKNGFRAISFEYSNVLDSYFIHRYIIIKYRSSLITDKIHQLLSE